MFTWINWLCCRVNSALGLPALVANGEMVFQFEVTNAVEQILQIRDSDPHVLYRLWYHSHRVRPARVSRQEKYRHTDDLLCQAEFLVFDGQYYWMSRRCKHLLCYLVVERNKFYTLARRPAVQAACEELGTALPAEL